MPKSRNKRKNKSHQDVLQARKQKQMEVMSTQFAQFMEKYNASASVPQTNPDSNPFEPNDETIAAMREARQGKLKSFDSIEALMADLNADH